jgi:phosphatidylethanolamine/phosphatidyl-N-methylethanolamine N-methyltransferase
LLFVRRFLKHPLQTAALAPSSPHLAEKMADSIPLSQARAVLELGPGTGALTKAIVPRLRPGARYLTVERDPVLAAVWRERFPSHALVQGDVRDLAALCKQHGSQSFEAIVSGLPWPSFPAELQDCVMDQVVDLLSPRGHFVLFGYHLGLMMPNSRRFFRLLDERFRKVERLPWVWRNLPPAYVLRCSK